MICLPLETVHLKSGGGGGGGGRTIWGQGHKISNIVSGGFKIYNTRFGGLQIFLHKIVGI